MVHAGGTIRVSYQLENTSPEAVDFFVIVQFEKNGTIFSDEFRTGVLQPNIPAVVSHLMEIPLSSYGVYDCLVYIEYPLNNFVVSGTLPNAIDVEQGYSANLSNITVQEV
jgi:hypothetical protein